MIKQLTISVLLLFILAYPLHAHRLNEYLQATRITIARDNIGLHMDFTSGTGLAQKLLKEIDADGDGIFSPPEQRAYIDRMTKTIALIFDGNPVALRPVSWHFPGAEEIKKGTGEIQFNLNGEVLSAKTSHQLVFKNTPQASAVYLVNCLLPADTAIQITAQSRNSDQSVYTLDYTTSNDFHTRDKSVQEDNFTPVKSFFFHGVNHILTGYDHLLFLCALLLGAASLWDLIKIVTAFTLAHSVTLTLAAFGLVHVPSYITEPIIAASIVCIALLNIFRPPSSAETSRIAVVFLFGLFHGLGFAGGLLELMHTMPRQALVYALLGFSIGVEAGNQMVLLPLYGFLHKAKNVYGKKPKQAGTLQFFASGIVALAGLYYLFISLDF